MLTETTAELAAALTLAAARRVPEADVFMRAGKYKGWLPTLFVGQLLQARLISCFCCRCASAIHERRVFAVDPEFGKYRTH